MEELFLIFAGAITGIVAVVLGIGGGVLIVPCLYALHPQWPLPTVIAHSLGIITLASSFHVRSFMGYRSAIAWRGMVPLMLGAVFSSILGAQYVSHIPVEYLRRFIAVFLILLVAKNLRELAQGQRQQSTTAKPVFASAKMLAIGLLGGALSSLAGVGGGVVYMPAALHYLRLPHHQASMVSHIGIAVTAASGFLVHWYTSQLAPMRLDYQTIILFFLGMIIVSKLAVKVVAKVDKKKSHLLQIFLYSSIALRFLLI